MTVIETAIRTVERAPIPDAVLRLGIAAMVGKTSRRLAADEGAAARFAAEMNGRPIALNAADANAQHYEVPAEFFELVLGPQRKYSCCLYPSAAASLAEAEEHALAETARHAGLRDGHTILELGCGWGSLSLWMARAFPNSRILAVSNSHSQRSTVRKRAAALECANLEVVTADMNVFAPDRTFDRIVSVEMFEHMANWRLLLSRVRSWLEPGGRLFVHVFAHRATPYRFDHNDKSDWIAQYFFTGGLMPSRGLMHQFADVFAVEEEWWWDGSHYARTANEWLANHDRHSDAVLRALAPAYAGEAHVWQRRWRLFFLATAGLFGHNGGADWGVSHYLLRPACA